METRDTLSNASSLVLSDLLVNYLALFVLMTLRLLDAKQKHHAGDKDAKGPQHED